MDPNLNLSQNRQTLSFHIESTASRIADVQRPSGEIPWCEGEKTDPWDHVEAAMGLSVGGYLEQAKRAYQWMARTQQADGSWCTAYRNGIPEDATRDANMSSYIAVGLFHYYLITGDIAFLRKMWPTILSAVRFALRLQAHGGEIYWAISPEGRIDPMALVTGSSSIHMSLKCALAIAAQLGHSIPEVRRAGEKLADAVRNKPYLFNMTKSRYSMDWYYPVLSGIVTGEAARRRIGRHWQKFVISGQGVRCVSDRPWVTIAETAELSLALSAMGNRMLSEIVFNWISDKKSQDGDYWCGYTYPDMTIWPEDTLTWTNAVVLMAADALYGLTPASRLFDHGFWVA